MAEHQPSAARQRRIGAYAAIVLGVVNLVLGVVVGAPITIGVAVFLLIVGGVVLASSMAGAGPPPG